MNMRFERQADPLDNGVVVLKNLVKLLKLKVTDDSIEDVRDTDGYPSLASMAAALNQWGVRNLAIRIPPEHLQTVPVPAIGVVKTELGEQFSVVSDINPTSVSYVDCAKGAMVVVSIEEFIKRWTGVILAVEVTAISGEDSYDKKIQKRKSLRNLRLLSNASIIVLLAAGLALSGSGFITLLIIKTLTLFSAILVLNGWLGINNSLIDSLCKTHSKLDCSTVLGSRTSRIKNFHLSEIAMLYAVGGWISVFTGSLMYAIVPPLFFYLSAATLPITIATVYLQFKLRAGCSLCLLLTATLWSEFVFLALSIGEFRPDLKSILVVAFGFTLPLAIWGRIRDTLMDGLKVPSLNKSLSGFHRDTTILQHILTGQTKVFLEEGIVFGDVKSAFDLTAVISPSCAPCALAFKSLMSMRESFDDGIKINIIFKVDRENRKAYRMALHVLTVYKKDRSLAWEALVGWYTLGYDLTMEKWFSKYSLSGMESASPDDHEILDRHRACVNRLLVESTPTVYINSKKFPVKFGMTNLQYHVSTLMQRTSTINNSVA